jgi:hypothetical protein
MTANSDASTYVDLQMTPAEPETTAATRLALRGHRSEHDCGLSSMPGRPISELLPRAQAFLDSQAREALRRFNLEATVATLRPERPARPMRRHRTVDPRKVEIAKLKGLGYVGFGIALALDKTNLPPPTRYSKPTNRRLWAELYQAKRYGFPKIQRNVRKFIRIVQPFVATRPVATGKSSGNPHKQGDSSRSATDKGNIALGVGAVSLDCKKAK